MKPLHIGLMLMLLLWAPSILGAAELPAKSARQPAKEQAPLTVPLAAEPARRFSAQLRTWQQIKEYHVVMQQQDYSCGAAALATELQYYFGDDVSEEKILKTIFAGLDAKETKDRQKNGLSMDDLFKASEKLGYQATVYPVGLRKLKELKAPVIVRIIKGDYKHFVVYRGAIEDRIYLADPIRGNIRVDAAEFAKEWNGVALILGKEGFGLPERHGLALDREQFVRPELQTARRSLNEQAGRRR